MTEIERWLRDPYGIYARHILALRALDPLDESADAARYGELAHRGLHDFVLAHGVEWPRNAAASLGEAMGKQLVRARLREALIAWWSPRFSRIAAWVAEHEALRRVGGAPAMIVTEHSGEWRLDRPGGPFFLRGRADRIERRGDGQLVILDYKTGTPPTQKQVDAGYAPQLPLEAAMAAAGAFGVELVAEAAELTYWHLTGGYDRGEAVQLYKGKPEQIAVGVARAREKLLALIDAYDDPNRGYLAQPHPNQRLRFSDYEQLARVAEWAPTEG